LKSGPDFLYANVPREGFNKSIFHEQALRLFDYQYRHNPILGRFADLLGRRPGDADDLTGLPFLPISFFKTAEVVTGSFRPEAVFTSSGTTGSVGSQHLVARLADYRASFTEAFRLFYGDPASWCILALLPSYLERSGSSLVLMADELIRLSGHPSGGFFLHDTDRLRETLSRMEGEGQRTLLLGVTYALMDFADAHPMRLRHTVVMETGGMKGRRRELTRGEVHDHLRERLGIETVHSEYGMTELLSQAYSSGGGIFRTPPWMRVLVRAEDDPLTVMDAQPDRIVSGAINVIDLANRSSCAFIATDDLGRLHPDGSFEVIGRIDHSDIRGCSLMYV
jgi:hypothetical protein